jgi:cobalamin biosynthesis Co2+ chelatase CbiK
MFVAGEYIMNDVLGDGSYDEPSWQSQLAGLDIDGAEKGLGFNEKNVALYFANIKEALGKIA